MRWQEKKHNLDTTMLLRPAVGVVTRKVITAPMVCRDNHLLHQFSTLSPGCYCIVLALCKFSRRLPSLTSNKYSKDAIIERLMIHPRTDVSPDHPILVFGTFRWRTSFRCLTQSSTSLVEIPRYVVQYDEYKSNNASTFAFPK